MKSVFRAFALGVVTLASLSPTPKCDSARKSGPETTTRVNGPRPCAAPESAVVAHDEEELRRLLADASGPPAIWLEGRTYHGDFHIGRAVALHGTSGTLIEGSGTTTVLGVEADDASIANVTVRGSGRRYTTEDAGIKAKGNRVRVEDVLVDHTLFGISFQECHDCVIERAHVVGTDDDMGMRGDGVKLWESHRSIVRDTLVEHSRDLVVWYSRHALLERNEVRGGRYGTHFMYAHDGVVRGSKLHDNVVGIFVMYSQRLHVEGNVLAGAHGAAGVGIGFKESDGVKVIDNAFVANTTGAYFDRTPRSPAFPVEVRGNVFAIDDVALRFHSSQEGIELTDNDFVGNGDVAEVEGGGDAAGTKVEHNYWSEYAGYDLDGDGFGDVPFEHKKLSTEMADVHPSLRFFQGTAAMGLMDAVAHAVPILTSRTVLADRQPAMREHRTVRP